MKYILNLDHQDNCRLIVYIVEIEDECQSALWPPQNLQSFSTLELERKKSFKHSYHNIQ